MKTGTLLLNVGSPAAPEKAEIRAFLREFLMDRHVLPLPLPARAAVVFGRVLPQRPARLAPAYASIWMPEGSPLTVHTLRLAEGLARRIGEPVEAGMTYAPPRIETALSRLRAAGAERVVCLPLFPHAAPATTGAAESALREAARRMGFADRTRILPPFGERDAFAALWHAAIGSLAPEERLILSFHGLPERTARKIGYLDACAATARKIADALDLPSERRRIAFQSRFGRGKWTGPALNDVLLDEARNGARRVVVACPSFFCDGLETLEEVGSRSRRLFLDAGGERFRLVPCPNASPAAVDFLATLREGFGP